MNSMENWKIGKNEVHICWFMTLESVEFIIIVLSNKKTQKNKEINKIWWKDQKPKNVSKIFSICVIFHWKQTFGVEHYSLEINISLVNYQNTQNVKQRKEMIFLFFTIGSHHHLYYSKSTYAKHMFKIRCFYLDFHMRKANNIRDASLCTWSKYLYFSFFFSFHF